jgi:hypothetical protein
MIDISKLTPAQLEQFIHVQAQVDRQANDAALVRLMREYYDGEHPVMLTTRQQEFLGALLADGMPTFAHNLVKATLDTLRERLNVTGISAGEDDDAANTEIAAAMWEWFERARLAAEQIRLYRRALRDGKTYLMVDYDAVAMRPRFTLHHLDAGESQPGVMLHRDPEDENRVLFAVRYWYTGVNPLRPGEAGVARKTVYLPGEIRKYSMGKAGQWQPYQDEGDASWPLPWVDVTGEPLGIPIVEFANPGGSEAEQIIGLQNALNKSWLDLIAAADHNGFPVLALEYDTTRLGPSAQTQSDADNKDADEIRFSPGRLLEVDDAVVHRIEAANPVPMIAVIDRIEQAISGVSRTPAYYLRPVGGGEVPSGEALKQLESGLVRRAEERQLVFGQSWDDVFALAYRVNQTYGERLPDVDKLSVHVTWADANVRNELVIAQVAEAHGRLGVPKEEQWRMVGYTPEQIEGFKNAELADNQAKVAAVAAAFRVDASRTGAQQGGKAQRNGTQGTNTQQAQNERTEDVQ